MKFQNFVFAAIALIFVLNSCNKSDKVKNDMTNLDMNNMMIRMAEIEIDSNYIDDYKAILKEESEASVRLEPGVIAIYPMYRKDNPTQIRLLEIYAGREVYESHLKTPHFLNYKTSTLKMVKSLKLIDMEPIDIATMPKIFRKLP